MFDQLTILLSRQDIEESRITRKFNITLQQNNIENVSVLGASIQATKKLGVFSNVNYGAELYQNTVKSDGYKIDIYSGNISSINTRYPDRGSNLTMNGFYAIYNLQKDHFSIVSGIRYTFNKVSGNFTANTTQLIFPDIMLQNNSLNGSFNLSYYPHQRTKITFDLSSGFKSPNVDDLGKVFTKDGFITLPNNNLSPEHSYCGAIGWNQKFYLLSNRLKIHFNNSAYATLLEDVIVKKEFEVNGSYQLLYNSNWYEILANQNSGNALIYGFSSSFDLSIFEKIRLHSGLTYTKGLIIKDNIPFGHIPPLIGNFSIRFSQNNWNYSIFTVFNSYKKIEDFGQGNVDNPNEATLLGFPDWWTLNGKVSYQLNKKLRIMVGCYNVLDFHYKTFASGISSPGRSFMVSFKLSY
jgi:hemoglobin/transferrin/lactoferrin receptor protein